MVLREQSVTIDAQALHHTQALVIRKALEDRAQKQARFSVASSRHWKACRSCVPGARLAGSLILAHWLLIHDQGTEASVGGPHIGCFSAES